MPACGPISPKTRLCALIGDPVGHSMSPAIHNRAFTLTGFDGVYLAFRVQRGESARVLDGMRAMENFLGLSVTIPHKVDVAHLVDDLSETDAAIGSINTIIHQNGRLRGLGSDGPGARKALLDAGISTTDSRVVLLGTGGAARAIAFDLAFHARPSEMVLLGVVDAEMRQLEADLLEKTGVSVTSRRLDDTGCAAALKAPGILINATPVGMVPDIHRSLIPEHLLHPKLSVMDIVYHPMETRLLSDARRLGLKTVSGVDMFVNQAAIQFEAWTNQPAPVDAMREVVVTTLSATD